MTTIAVDSIVSACHALFAPGQVTELFCPGQRGPSFGWFTDWNILAHVVAQYDTAWPEGWYITPNPVSPAILNRFGPNNFSDRGRASRTTDRDIIHRHWFLIDLDPVRVAGVSSTDQELALARVAHNAIRSYLEESCWPAGLSACSGNGWHLLYRVDLPNDDQAKALCSAALQTLSARFSSDHTKVDKTVFNAARLFKLYGTVARKGVSSSERPHRLAYLEATPPFGELGTVSAAQLQALANSDPGPRGAPAARRRGGGSRAASKPVTEGALHSDHTFDLDSFVAKHNLPILARRDCSGGFQVTYPLARCLFDPSHDKPGVAALGRSDTGRIWYKCQHESCATKQWADVRELFEPGAAMIASTGANDSQVVANSTSPFELARAILDELWTDRDLGGVHLRRHRETFYLYSPARRAYVPLGQDEVRIEVAGALEGRVENVTRRLTGDVIAALESLVTLRKAAHRDIPFFCQLDLTRHANYVPASERNWITLQNGIFDVAALVAGEPMERCLYPHTPDWLTLTALDFPFPQTEAERECPAWHDFLWQIMEGDDERIDLIQEMMGYIFLPSCRYESFFLLTGLGQNGKSTVLDTISALVTNHCLSALSLEQLFDRTLVHQLYGKLVNIGRDLPMIDKAAEHLLKIIASGEMLECDRKYKEGVKFQPRAKLIFACNNPPIFRDTSEGIWRRMVLIPFKYYVSCEERVPDYFKRRLAPELPAIFAWAMEGLVRLIRNDRFTEPAICVEEKRQYKAECFPILLFLDDQTVPEGEVEIGHLLQAYKRWAEITGYTRSKPPLAMFQRDVLAFRSGVRVVPVPGRSKIYTLLRGISLRPSDLPSLLPPCPDWYGKSP